MVDMSVEDKREAEIRQWMVGIAYFTFAGMNDVHSYLDLTPDPNARLNPRPLNPVHAAKLTEIFSQLGAKRDKRTPILAMIDESAIDPETRTKMELAKNENSNHPPPKFKTIRPHEERESELEYEKWWRLELKGRKFLTGKDVDARQTELDQLRSERIRATLINGNHRTWAMIGAGDALASQRDTLAELLAKGQITPEEVVVRMESLTKSLSQLTYRVAVYRGKFRTSWGYVNLL